MGWQSNKIVQKRLTRIRDSVEIRVSYLFTYEKRGDQSWMSWRKLL